MTLDKSLTQGQNIRERQSSKKKKVAGEKCSLVREAIEAKT
jgi:hypothetical protein